MGIVNATPDSFSGDGRPLARRRRRHGLSARRTWRRSARHRRRIDAPGHLRSTRPKNCGGSCRSSRLAHARPGRGLSIDTHKPRCFGPRTRRAATCSIRSGARRRTAGRRCDARRSGRHHAQQARRRVRTRRRRRSARVSRARSRPRGRRRASRPKPSSSIRASVSEIARAQPRVLGALDRLVALGFPTLLGTSRKSTIGKLTGRKVGARTYGTAATVALAVAAEDRHRARARRRRDARRRRVADAIVRGWRPAGWRETL
jgi:hypothetical protein